MTSKELSEKFDELYENMNVRIPEELQDDISFKQFQLVYTMMLKKQKETPTFEDIDDAYLNGGYWARRLLSKKYEKLIGFIDLLTHGALTKDQHEILNKVLEYSELTEEDLRRIRLVYPPEMLLK